jgi:hypothetical protein
MHTYDKSLWQSIGAARYDFGAVGAALFSAFGLAASITASAHVVGSLFNASYEATAYGVALFLLAEGVAYYIEVLCLFEGRLRWWLWLLRWVGPLLSAAAGGLAAYGWLPDAYKGLALVTTVVVPLFQWGFLSLLMDRIRAVHSRRIALQSETVAPAPEQQLLTMYRAIQHQRSLDDLKRLEAMIGYDAQPVLTLPRQPMYAPPVQVQADQVATRQTDDPQTESGTVRVADRNAPKTYTCKRCGDGGMSFAELGRHARGCKG